MKKTGLLVAFIIVLLSCNEDNNLETYSNYFIGIWEWQSTNGGVDQNFHITPKLVDKIIHLELKSNNEFVIKLDNAENISGIYSISNRKSNLTQNTEQFISMAVYSEEYNGIVVFEGLIKIYNNFNSVFIEQDFEDGIGSVFKREV